MTRTTMAGLVEMHEEEQFGNGKELMEVMTITSP